MKTNLTTLILAFLSIITYAQTSKNDKIIFLDSKWKETTPENYSYTRIIKNYNSKQDLYEIKEFYKSGAIRTEGFSKDKNQFAKEGEIITYYENGNKKEISHYSNKKLIGKEEEWYENGNKKSEIEYTPEEKETQNKLKILNYWNTNNIQTVIDGNGDYEENSKDFYSKGKLKNGYKDGIWEGKDLKENFTFTEIYQNNKFISGVSTDNNNQKYPYKILNLKPAPKNGINDFYKYIAKNLKSADIQNLNGQVRATFWIDKDGKITDIKILKDIGYGIGEEVIRLLQAMEKWIPGTKRGVPLKMQHSLPISFKGATVNYENQNPTPGEDLIKNTNPNW
ncbi:TonB protein C-terminal [Flavobacterium glycines]|uniref:TonB protein C-terminal n=1 Tax=Flavobacterium glycines TaxID=551990 RepID=A0A1B9DRF9_9FLAO|nr:energy transducer TonB [Flavobacterium glycines]OCB72279.1 hypothetical protein FBGL_06355 [Flavobacterium glycines]GEL09743.1 hypothetical protein FGL01_04820 [Flavobacterium glycines]SDI95413.1 TonB protein C-terminal [Flavobacterium glycines]